MATCKNCLHYDACVDMLQSMGFVVDGDGYLADRRCRIFKDKSHFVELPCRPGDTVYGKFSNYGKTLHKCTVIKSKVCQFKDRSLHYFLDVEFYIIDPFYADGRLMRCHYQAVFGEDFGSWDRVYLTREEAEAAKKGEQI